MAVGDDLHFDVAGAGQQPLEEDGAVAESLERLAAGALEGRAQLGVRAHFANAATAAAGGGLDHQWVAQALGVASGLLQGLHRAAAPRRHRHPRLLGELLGADLVAQPAHDLSRRADEDDVELVAQIDERGVLGDEPPADPDRLDPVLDHDLTQAVVVEIGVLALAVPGVDERRRAEQHRFVGLAHEHRSALGLGIEGDGGERWRLLGVELACGVELPYGVDGAHRGFATIDDR